MNKHLMKMVLPRLARPLYLQLQKYQTGQLSDLQFSENFEELLQKQHHWLSQKGISAAKAAVTIHAAVLVLSQPGLCRSRRGQPAAGGDRIPCLARSRPRRVPELRPEREPSRSVPYRSGGVVRRMSSQWPVASGQFENAGRSPLATGYYSPCHSPSPSLLGPTPNASSTLTNATLFWSDVRSSHISRLRIIICRRFIS